MVENDVFSTRSLVSQARIGIYFCPWLWRDLRSDREDLDRRDLLPGTAEEQTPLLVSTLRSHGLRAYRCQVYALTETEYGTDHISL